ncbi:MAG: DUF3572 domain-containing protein [Sphingomonadales bacterium]|nr:DUF3572 domain-containing protein [Sphingomonadales bacterium]
MLDRPAARPDDFAAALSALAWTLSDDDRAARLLALTGLDPDELRAKAGDPVLLAALIAFLAGHEPDLIACAEAIGCPPAALVAIGERLSDA